MVHRLVALMPMRHSSERVKGKNFRPFGDGRPLYQHVLDILEQCPLIDRVVIDTDSPVIREQCAEHYPDVILLERPEHLRAGETPMNEVLLHDIAQVPSEFYLQTHSTNPLITVKTVNTAIETFFRNYPTYDSLFSVTRYQTRLWDQLVRPINHNPDILLRTQDLPPLYEENSCIYIFNGKTLQEKKNRLSSRPYMYEMSPWEAIDIDEEINFRIAEVVYRERAEGRLAQ
ncbi:acylneuraminate cytidylyltransferase family protein [Stappia sp. F7233]|uniref:Acylneuraminate cytidylyltransferase family protein n=1 Tax=Stappia albiluteola TaxID=2758565 RepID=A0A839AHR1_9HYPH|nr:acylneuraminate cytidylyltransferase family protein [Stappia albiluteola]MBA5778049.1 acylneuraminate cytidylyltransferase family protein [Stappia albiluteola]